MCRGPPHVPSTQGDSKVDTPPPPEHLSRATLGAQHRGAGRSHGPGGLGPRGSPAPWEVRGPAAARLRPLPSVVVAGQGASAVSARPGLMG